MNNIDMLTSALVAEPFNPILAAMLKDELCDAKDMTNTEAARHVVHVVADGCRLRQLQRAADLLAEDCPARRLMLTELSAFLGFIDLVDITIVVVEGDRAPTLTVRACGSRSCYWPSQTVSVGAAWLLSQLLIGSR